MVNKNIRQLNWTLISVFYLIGILTGIFIGKSYIFDKPAPHISEKRIGHYQFISPLLDYDIPDNLDSSHELHAKRLEEALNREINKGNVSNMAIYFKDLVHKQSFGMNEEERFYPGSLMKIPLMLAHFSEEQLSPGYLETKIKHSESIPDFGQYIKPDDRLKLGGEYSYMDLIYSMIVYSNNDAAYLLAQLDRKGGYLYVLRDIGIENADYITLKEYAALFRILYNASYLSRDMSELALRILSVTNFKEGIVGGVPSDIRVAHKFGEKEDLEGTKYFHDCGIVYYPSHPYILCVMTKGDDFREMISSISDISRSIFEIVKEEAEMQRGR